MNYAEPTWREAFAKSKQAKLDAKFAALVDRDIAKIKARIESNMRFRDEEARERELVRWKRLSRATRDEMRKTAYQELMRGRRDER